MHEKVKLVGKGEHLRRKIAALQGSNLARQVFLVRPSSDGELFLMFPDATELGYLSERMKLTLNPLIELPYFEIEAWTTLNSILDALSKAKMSAEATIRVECVSTGWRPYGISSAGSSRKETFFYNIRTYADRELGMTIRTSCDLMR